jgi:hypothetical protein
MASPLARFAAMAAVACMLTIAVAQTQEPADPAAQESAKSWLALIDAGKYPASWDAAGSIFKKRITKDNWAAAVKGARTPFGALKSRTLKSATPATTLPGAPDGDYVVLQFDASFEHKEAAVETVTAMRDTDKAWHIAGYFIK